MNVDRHYVAARRVLMDALEDLVEHADAVVVVGAQAVYIRCGATNIGIADYTTDGDLALDCDRMTEIPLLEDAMRARFTHAVGQTGHEQPGVWTRTVEVGGELIEVPVDLIVPEGIEPPGGSRGARLAGHGKRAARKASGLEAAMVDNDVLAIRAFESEDVRVLERRVAGPTALLIAKAYKIHDRLAEPERLDRVIDKDASDAYRLMVTTPAARVNGVVSMLLKDDRIGAFAERGLEMLRTQFGARRAPGVEMAVRALRLGVPEDRVRNVCVSFIAHLS